MIKIILISISLLFISVNLEAHSYNDNHYAKKHWKKHWKKHHHRTYGGCECNPCAAGNNYHKRENNGFGNGDQDAPGNSLPHNNAENSDHQWNNNHDRWNNNSNWWNWW